MVLSQKKGTKTGCAIYSAEQLIHRPDSNLFSYGLVQHKALGEYYNTIHRDTTIQVGKMVSADSTLGNIPL